MSFAMPLSNYELLYLLFTFKGFYLSFDSERQVYQMTIIQVFSYFLSELNT